MNINMIRYENFKRDIMDRFHLDGLAVRVIVDNSRHYIVMKMIRVYNNLWKHALEAVWR